MLEMPLYRVNVEPSVNSSSSIAELRKISDSYVINENRFPNFHDSFKGQLSDPPPTRGGALIEHENVCAGLITFQAKHFLKPPKHGKYFDYVFQLSERYPANTLEILSLETAVEYSFENPNRLASPIGKWLLWYVIKLACSIQPSGSQLPLIFFKAEIGSESYYRHLGFQDYGTVDDNYPQFAVDQSTADKFFRTIEKKFGKPIRIQ